MSRSCGVPVIHQSNPDDDPGTAATALLLPYSHRQSARAGKAYFRNRKRRRRNMSGPAWSGWHHESDWIRGRHFLATLYVRTIYRTETKIATLGRPSGQKKKKQGRRVRGSPLLRLPQPVETPRKLYGASLVSANPL